MELTTGGNVELDSITAPEGSYSVILGLTWESGSEECHACALICGPDRQVVQDEHFLFWDNRTSPERAVFLRLQGNPHDASTDRAQLLVDLTGLPADVEMIVLTLATLLEGNSLRSVTRLRLRAIDPGTGQEVASYTMDEELADVTCAVVAELYRNRGAWKLRAVGQGYDAGLVGLGRDHGIDLYP